MDKSEFHTFQPLISVIITTKNEEENIRKCLDSIKNQTYQKYEIILVDNYSTDNTANIAKEFTEHVYCYGPERSTQRNYAVEKSQGEYLLLLDADQTIPDNLLCELVSLIQKQPILVGIQIPENIVGKGFWIKVRNFEKHFYDNSWIDVSRFIKKQAFVNSGGFDISLTGPEDWDLDRRIRQQGETGFIEIRFNHDEGEFDISKYLQKKAYYSKSFDTYISKWNNDYVVNYQLGFYSRFFGVFIENGKWKYLFSHPILAVGMYYLKLRVGFVYITRDHK